MMNGNFNYGNQGGYIPNGMIYQPAQTKLNMTQGLTPEELKSLRKTGGFSLDISRDELLRSYCTHRQDNRFTVRTDEEGNVECALCGTKFKSFNGKPEEVKEIVDRVVDIMETTKMQALNLPPSTIQGFFQIEPLLKRLPDLYAQSQNDYKNALNIDTYTMGYDNNAFVQYQNIINPMAGNNYYDPAMMNMGQPMYNNQQPMYNNQQPMMNIGQPMYNNQQPMMNMGQPMYNNQQTQTNPFSGNPAPVNNNQQQAQPQSDNNNVTVSKKLTD